VAGLIAYIHPACSKCRRLLEILEERGAAVTVVDYLKTPPDRATLEGIVAMPDIVAPELVRRDKRFAELGLTDAHCATAAQVVELLLAHPELLERPLVVAGGRALVARPPEKVLALLTDDAR
jgi:arsenate reductase